MGDRTHNQLQSMWSVSFSVMNMSARIDPKPIPPPADVFESFAIGSVLSYYVWIPFSVEESLTF